MPDPLPALEQRRSQLLLAIAQLGDFRPGSIHAAFRRFQQRLDPSRPASSLLSQRLQNLSPYRVLT